MQYNLCNEPWLKFSIGTIADRGLKASQWTGSRLSSDVLYVETHRWCSPPNIDSSRPRTPDTLLLEEAVNACMPAAVTRHDAAMRMPFLS